MPEYTKVLVIGGGSTGTSVARDLVRRGVEGTLVESGTLAHGTTGRMHGLLHSGSRYAVSDSESARLCIAENRISQGRCGPLYRADRWALREAAGGPGRVLRPQGRRLPGL